jgi:hypothetical protein
MSQERRPTIETAQAELADHLMPIASVVGLALGEYEGEPSIKVLVVGEGSELIGRVPPTYRGFPVVVEAVGMIRGPRRPQ